MGQRERQTDKLNPISPRFTGVEKHICHQNEFVMKYPNQRFSNHLFYYKLHRMHKIINYFLTEIIEVLNANNKPHSVKVLLILKTQFIQISIEIIIKLNHVFEAEYNQMRDIVKGSMR